MAIESKLSNPKDLVGADKIPFHLWPETATALGSLGLLDGALKYGRANFRAVGVRASIYYDACRRHMNKWFEGEDTDPDSGLPHLAHALACLAILVDAHAAGKLNDDRQYPGGYAGYIESLTPHVKRLKDKYKDRLEPVHYTHAAGSDEYKIALESAQKLKETIKKKWAQSQATLHRPSDPSVPELLKSQLLPKVQQILREGHCTCKVSQADNADVIECQYCLDRHTDWGV